MRKALFAIVLVSASFAGGAVVNGPGLRWAQTLVMNRLGIEEDEPSAAAANASAEEIPPRPIPPLIIEPTATAPDTRAAPAAETSRPERSPKRDDRPSPSPSSSSSTASALPGLAPVPEGATPPLDPIPPLSASRDPGPAETPPLAAATPDQDKDKDKDQAKAPEKGDDPSVRRASVANLGDPSPADAPAATATATTAPTPGDWSEVRETMRKLGVSRYGIDGDPAGRVRFHCLIPLAGRRAVGQHFEAEGDDDLQAARSALKRVALWKAAGGAP